MCSENSGASSFEVLCNNNESDEEETKEEDQRRDVMKDNTNKEKKEIGKCNVERMSLEALKTMIDDCNEGNKSTEDAAEGDALGMNEFKIEKVNAEETSYARISRDELENDMSFDCAVSLEDNGEKEEIIGKLLNKNLEEDFLDNNSVHDDSSTIDMMSKDFNDSFSNDDSATAKDVLASCKKIAKLQHQDKISIQQLRKLDCKDNQKSQMLIENEKNNNEV